MLFLVLLVVAGILAFSSNRRMQSLRNRAEERARLSAALDESTEKMELWLAGDAPIEEVKAAHEKMAAQLARTGSDIDVDKIWQLESKTDALMKKNQGAGDTIYKLTTGSAGISDAYIDGVVKKLADPKARKEVSTLERLVVQGAHFNTAHNLTIQTEFEQLKQDVRKADVLLKHLDGTAEEHGGGRRKAQRHTLCATAR